MISRRNCRLIQSGDFSETARIQQKSTTAARPRCARPPWRGGREERDRAAEPRALSPHQAMNSPSTPTPPWGNLNIQDAKNAEPRDVPLHGKEALMIGRADQAHLALPRRNLTRPANHQPTTTGGHLDSGAVHFERPLYHTHRRHRVGHRHFSHHTARHVSSHGAPRPACPRALSPHSLTSSSANGTFVNGKRIEKNVDFFLQEGQSITFSKVREGGRACATSCNAHTSSRGSALCGPRTIHTFTQLPSHYRIHRRTAATRSRS